MLTRRSTAWRRSAATATPARRRSPPNRRSTPERRSSSRRRSPVLRRSGNEYAEMADSLARNRPKAMRGRHPPLVRAQPGVDVRHHLVGPAVPRPPPVFAVIVRVIPVPLAVPAPLPHFPDRADRDPLAVPAGEHAPHLVVAAPRPDDAVRPVTVHPEHLVAA